MVVEAVAVAVEEVDGACRERRGGWGPLGRNNGWERRRH